MHFSKTDNLFWQAVEMIWWGETFRSEIRVFFRSTLFGKFAVFL